ncbi:MAG: hypothetical protein HUK26_09770, partial [Duodenibacillus sp.]|nr:hypothetical protein [Duodenibacillus sp.]
RDGLGRAIVAGWLDGGGRQQLFFPPTKVRAVLADDPAVIGWARAAGILDRRTGRASGARAWPADAPQGDCLALVEDLYEPWLARDWRLWSERVPAAVEQAQALMEAARAAKGCDSGLAVGFGEDLAVSLPVKLRAPKGLLARFSRGVRLEACDWIFEPGAGGAA